MRINRNFSSLKTLPFQFEIASDRKNFLGTKKKFRVGDHCKHVLASSFTDNKLALGRTKLVIAKLFSFDTYQRNQHV